MTARRLLAGFAVVVLATLFGLRPAGAHAELESTTPADGAHVDTAPATVVLTFSEHVSAPPGGTRIIDASGQRVDSGDVDVDGNTITVGLDGGLGDGTYIVAWRALSADSHPVRGAFTFTVGDGPTVDDAHIAALLAGGSDRPWHIAGAVARGVGYLGVLLSAGGALYLVIVDDGVARFVRVLLVAAVAGTVGVLAALPVQAQLATGLGVTAIFRSGVAGDVLGDGVGLSTALTVLGLAAIAVALFVTGPSRWPTLALGAVAAIGGFAVAGHTTETDPAWLASGADVVHAGAGAAWFGGLVLLAVGLRRLDAPTSADAVTRFSRLATAAVIAIGIAGVALGWAEVRTLDALTTTTYGRLLIAKVAIVAAVALVGAFNRTRLVPAIVRARDPSRARRALRRTVAVEAGALVVAIALTAVLVNVTPARAAIARPFSATQTLGDGTVNLVVDPAADGPVSIHLYLLDQAGRPTDLPDGSELTLDLRLPSADIGPIERTPFAAGPGHYQLDTDDLTVPGTWQITVSARVARFEVQTATIDVPVRP